MCVCITKDYINIEMKLWKLMKIKVRDNKRGKGYRSSLTPRKRIWTELSAEVWGQGRWGEGVQCVSDHRHLLLQSLHMKSLTIGRQPHCMHFLEDTGVWHITSASHNNNLFVLARGSLEQQNFGTIQRGIPLASE